MTERFAILTVYLLGLLAMLPQLVALVIVSWVAWIMTPVVFNIIRTIVQLF